MYGPEFLGGVPMIFIGDEVGYTNDYSILADPGKTTITVGCTGPLLTGKNKQTEVNGTIEHRIFFPAKKLLAIRKSSTLLQTRVTSPELTPHNIHGRLPARMGW